MNILSLHNKVAVITGASSGLGKHFALTLAKAGATTILIGRNESRLLETYQEVVQQGGSAFVVAVDLIHTTEIAEAVAKIVEKFQTIHILVNAAGIINRDDIFDLTEQTWDLVMDTNLKAGFLLTQAISKHMINQRIAGSIINVSSIAATRAIDNRVVYATSKAAINHLTKVLALELSLYGIRVNAIAPGVFETNINKQFLQTEEGQTLLAQIPLKRVGELHELDGILLLLASDASSYMTGCVMQIDGGFATNAINL